VSEAVTTTEHTETTTEVGHASLSTSQVLLRDPATWVFVAFIVFMALFVRYLAPMIGKGLDGRADKIRDQLEQASRLRAEAEALLASYKNEQEALLKQAESIIASAKSDAAALRVSAAEELKLALDRRAEQAKDKIARAEAEAVSSIRTRIIETASDKARDMLAQQAMAQSEEQMVAKAIAAIEQQVH
jgi:F-type H+-transporting ATPase subunit b